MTTMKTLLLSSFALFAMGAIAPSVPAFAEPEASTAPKEELPFNDAQKGALEDFVRNFILDNPEVLMDSVNRYREKMAAKADDDAKSKLALHKDNLLNGKHPEVGNPKGDVTVVEFFDYNCGYCKRAYEAVSKLVDSDKNVRVVFIELPILSPSSTTAAKWALAAQKQGKYWELHGELLTSNAPKDDENIEKAAKKLGLDVDKMKKDIASGEFDAVLAKNSEIAKDLGINGTPGFIIGDDFVRGFIEFEPLKTMISDKRSKAVKS